MKLRTTILSLLLALVPLATLGPIPAAAPGGGRDRPAEVEVLATGLVHPRGLDFGPGGQLYVSEHGYGGDPTAGRILRIRRG
jgi:glucose/arabinose dehydrogenase